MVSSPLPPQREISMQLGALITAWWSDDYRKTVLKSAGLSSNNTDTQVLWELSSKGSIRPSRLASSIGVGAPAITKAVTRLEALGYAVKTQDTSDLRSALISITPTGETIVSQIAEAGDALTATILESWSAREVTDFAAYVKRFTEASLKIGEAQLSSRSTPSSTD